MLRIYPVELNRVELRRRCVYAPVGRRGPVYNSAAYVTGAKNGNWITTDDWCVHTADTTQLDFVVDKLFRLVETRRDCRQLVANSIHTADATQLDSWDASAVYIGHYLLVTYLLHPSNSIWPHHRFCLPDLASSHWVHSLCLGYFVCVRLFSCIISACILYYCNTVRWVWLDWGLSGWLTTLFQCFDTVGSVIRPVKTVGRIT